MERVYAIGTTPLPMLPGSAWSSPCHKRGCLGSDGILGGLESWLGRSQITEYKDDHPILPDAFLKVYPIYIILCPCSLICIKSQSRIDSCVECCQASAPWLWWLWICAYENDMCTHTHTHTHYHANMHITSPCTIFLFRIFRPFWSALSLTGQVHEREVGLTVADCILICRIACRF